MSNQSNKSINTNSNNEVLKLVEKFGFKFFGFDEENKVLVVAPNSQVVLLSIAYDFVKKQIVRNSQQSPGGVEAIPQIPNFPLINDTSIESKMESSVEKQSDTSTSSTTPTLINTNVTKKASEVALPMLKEEIFGDGFKQRYKKGDIEEIKAVIKKAPKDKQKSIAWLKAEFEKYLKENEAGIST